jgi:hypothetical protein
MPPILHLGFAYLAATPLPRLVQPYLDRLSDLTQESCSVSVLDGTEIVYVARLPAPCAVNRAHSRQSLARLLHLDVGACCPRCAGRKLTLLASCLDGLWSGEGTTQQPHCWNFVFTQPEPP